MIVTLTANPSLDRTITLEGALRPGRGAVRGIRPARMPAARASTSRASSAAAGVDVGRGAAARRRRSVRRGAARAGGHRAPGADPRPRAREPHDHRPRRRHDQAQPARRGARRRPTGPRSSTPSSRHPRAPAGWCSPDRCRPGAGADFYVDVVARRACRATATTRRSSPSTRRAPPCTQVVRTRRARPHQTQRRGARRARRVRELDGERRPRRRDAPASHAPSCRSRTRAALVTLGAQGAVLVTADGAWHAGAPAHPGREHRRRRRQLARRLPARRGRGRVTRGPAAPIRPLRRGCGIPPRHPGAHACTICPPATCRSSVSPEPPPPPPTIGGHRVPDHHPRARQSRRRRSARRRRPSSALSPRASSQQGRATDAEALFADAWAREQKDETGLPGGIAIPHAKSAAVTEPSLAFARLDPGVDFGAPDGPADLVFLIAAPEGAAEAHLAVLSKLARSLMQDDFTSGPACREDERRGRRDRAQRDRGGGCLGSPRRGAPPRRGGRSPPRRTSRSTVAPPGSSPSPRARPASRTPSWPRTP